MSQAVKFWFDPACPFAWITSRWIHEVQKVREITPEFNVISLAVLNEKTDDQEDPDTVKKWMGARAAIAVLKQHGADKASEFYTAAGTRIHNEKYRMERYEEAISEALNEIGISDSVEILASSKTTQYDQDLRDSTAAALELVGDKVGTPIIALEENAFFGPVMTRIPRGEQAGEIWDGFLTLLKYPYFYELKRDRNTKLDFS